MATPLTDVGGKLTRRGKLREAIRERILKGDLKPGTRLLQLDLAKEYGVGQGAVREALLELKGYGLVDEVEHLGMFSCRMDKDELIQNYQVRAVHDGLAARLACERVNRADLRELRELAERAHEHRVRDQFVECSLVDRRFHQRIMEIAGNSVLERLGLGVRSAAVETPFARQDPHVSYREHLAILDAIADNQPDAAERLAREHVHRALDALVSAFESHEFSPQWVA